MFWVILGIETYVLLKGEGRRGEGERGEYLAIVDFNKLNGAR